jgi:hypothetical protein
MLIVSLGRKKRKRLNEMKFYFVHSTMKHNFILLVSIQSETFQVFAKVFILKAGWATLLKQAPTLPSPHPGIKSTGQVTP